MSDHHMHHQGHDHTTGVHGMLLFGGETPYLSHLPMFARPHNFQVLLHAGLPDSVQEAVVSHDHTVATEPYDTFVPDAFPISELDPDGSSPRATITGTIVCGHFERQGGKNPPIAADIEVSIERIVHFGELDVKAKHDTGADLSYLCFGRAGRLFLAHAITARPTFDQVLQVRVVPGSATDRAGRPLPDDAETLERFFRDTFEAATPVTLDRTDDPDQRLTAGQTPTALFGQKSPPSGFHGFRAELEVAQEIYVEIDELA